MVWGTVRGKILQTVRHGYRQIGSGNFARTDYVWAEKLRFFSKQGLGGAVVQLHHQARPKRFYGKFSLNFRANYAFFAKGMSVSEKGIKRRFFTKEGWMVSNFGHLLADFL